MADLWVPYYAQGASQTEEIDNVTYRVPRVDSLARQIVAEARYLSPTKVTQLYSAAGVAPHAATTRWTYTVPANKRAILDIISVFLLRDAAPATAGEALVYVNFTPSGGSTTAFLLVGNITAVVGTPQYQSAAAGWMLGAGDAIGGLTADGSTGGTYRLMVTLSATEFDA